MTVPPTETLPPRPADAAAATSRHAWIEAMEALTEDSGYFHDLGQRHWAYFLDEGTTLLVTFETLEAVRQRPDQMPLGHGLALRKGWSHLGILADGATWYRDPAVYAYFDRLVDDAFLEDFDRVLFYGAGMGGYAACAFSVTAPGARVLALNPRATLNPGQAGWDKRDPGARRLDFTSRYGYAPDMLDGAETAVILHDPTDPIEAMHAALFRAPHITRLSARHIGPELETCLQQMGSLPQLIDLAMDGQLDLTSFARLWRGRRDNGPYVRLLQDKAAAAGRSGHEIMICRDVTRRHRAPRMARRLARLLQDRAPSA